MKKLKRILFIIYDLERGGPELRLLDFCRNFPKELEIYICVLSNNLSMWEEFKAQNINIKVIPIARPYFELNKVRLIYKYVKDNQILVMNSFDIKGLIVSLLIKIFSMHYLKIVYHNVNSVIDFKFRQKALIRLLLKFVNFCVCNSEFSKLQFQQNFICENKITVIRNGIDTTLFKSNNSIKNELRAKYKIAKNDIVIGTVANFRRQKNYPFLIDSFKALSCKYDNL